MVVKEVKDVFCDSVAINSNYTSKVLVSSIVGSCVTFSGKVRLSASALALQGFTKKMKKRAFQVRAKVL